MTDYFVLLLAGSATALATGVGVLPVVWLGQRAVRFQAGMWGFAAGSMGVASVIGLLLPAFDEGSATAVIAGTAAGVAFMVGVRRLLRRQDIEVDGRRGASVRSSVLVFLVLLVHSTPEGMAIGSAYASETAGLGLFVILAIALQNIPEGTSVAIPMNQAGFSAQKQFWAAVATSVPQPLAAVVAYALVETVRSLLPFSFGFAAGAMLALVLVELLPKGITAGGGQTATGVLLGAVVMFALGVLVGV